jgi:cyclopropane fatty-acyl-phospholipid synthase-like methyltransferase
MTQIPTQQTFSDAYAGEAPWDIGRPQDAFVAVADQVKSPLLDAGCGTGDAAIYFAARGLKVTGVDFLEEAIRRARGKTAARGLAVEFRQQDALTLADSDERFASVIDSGLFHCFSDDDRRRYVRGLAHLLEPGGRLFLMCFSDAEPGVQGPRRVSRRELEEAFADGWKIESIEPSQFALNSKFSSNPAFAGMAFSEGGPKSWFAIVRRES